MEVSLHRVEKMDHPDSTAGLLRGIISNDGAGASESRSLIVGK